MGAPYIYDIGRLRVKAVGTESMWEKEYPSLRRWTSSGKLIAMKIGI